MTTVERQHESAKTKAQEKMVEESLTHAFNELRSGKVKRDARKLSFGDIR